MAIIYLGHELSKYKLLGIKEDNYLKTSEFVLFKTTVTFEHCKAAIIARSWLTN